MKEAKTFNVYSVKDELTGKFMQPLFIDTDEEAIRWFKYVLNSTGLWKANAAMYSLYKIGTFNEEEGLGDYPVKEMIQGGLAILEEN